MKFLITGATGFVGQHLTRSLLQKGHTVIGVGQSKKLEMLDDHFRFIQTDTTQEGDWLKSVGQMDCVINLAGTNIFNRWSPKYKAAIMSSRIETTKNIVNAMGNSKPTILVNASATGFYGNRGDEILTEDTTNGSDYLAEVCQKWETSAFSAKQKGVHVFIMRLGVVLGKGGGALSKMLPVFKSGLGGPIGKGLHWTSWIHIDDLIAGILYLIHNPENEGIYNFCAPDPVRNIDFSKILAKSLKRPAIFPVPQFMLNLIFGELGAALTSSQRTVPDHLKRKGFKFSYPLIEKAFQQIIA